MGYGDCNCAALFFIIIFLRGSCFPPHHDVVRLKFGNVNKSYFIRAKVFNVHSQRWPITQCCVHVCAILMCREVYILYLIKKKKNPIFFSTDIATVKVYLDI